ncbi:MAG: hypothetical protein P1V97_05830 [Planctomycetota bacterium]|nr:hypothetical protein [Planctomycetota bacterium]
MIKVRQILSLFILACVVGLTPAMGQEKESGRDDLDAASKLFGQGDYKSAREKLRLIYNSKDYTPAQRSKAGYLIGESLERVSEYKKAMNWYESFLKDHPNSRNAIHAKARLKSLRKNEGRFEKIVLGEKAWDLYTAGKYAETLELLKTLDLPKTVAETKSKPVTEDDIQFFIITGHCLRELEFYQESANAYEIAITLDSYDAEEFRDRSLRYITRLRIYWASLASMVLLTIVFISVKPWQHWNLELTKKLAITGISWGAAGVSLWLVGANMEVAEDVEKPILVADIVMLTVLLFLPIMASMVYGTAIKKRKQSWVQVRASVFSLLSCLSAMGIILHFKDWFMLVSL